MSSRTKRFMMALKKKIVKIPIIKIRSPPISSHLKAIKTAISKNNHGRALGALAIMPLIPPPRRSAPDNKAKIKSRVPSSNKTIRAKRLIICAVLCLPSLSISFTFGKNGQLENSSLQLNSIPLRQSFQFQQAYWMEVHWFRSLNGHAVLFLQKFPARDRMHR